MPAIIAALNAFMAYSFPSFRGYISQNVLKGISSIFSTTKSASSAGAAAPWIGFGLDSDWIRIGLDWILAAFCGNSPQFAADC